MNNNKKFKIQSPIFKVFLLTIFLSGIFQFAAVAQKRYGYAIMGLRCGNQDPERNRIYYSPIIELNTLNFPRYAEGIDPAIPLYSVRYYNYAISKWFEFHLKQYHNVRVTDPEEYQRKFTSVVFKATNAATCNDEKTDASCFFTDKDELSLQREKAIRENKSALHAGTTCEVISLEQ
jgi:hypothetical protein